MKLTDTKRRLLQDAEYIIRGYGQGQSLRYLAEVYNTSAGSIRTLLIEEGVVLRGRGRQRKENK
jgi:hypothetical protein